MGKKYSRGLLHPQNHRMVRLLGRILLPATPGRSPALSPSGSTLAVTLGTRSKTKMCDSRYIALLENPGAQPKVIFGTQDHHCCRPMWSPDGGMLMFNNLRDGKWGVSVINKDGSEYREVIFPEKEHDFINAACWGSDGKTLFACDFNNLYQVDLTGKRVKKIPFADLSLEVGGTPFAVQNYSPALEATLKEEIKHQEVLASAVQTLLASREFRQEAQIRKLVSQLLETQTYKRDKDSLPPNDANGEPTLSSFPPPFAALEALGEDAIPGLVKSLHDQRSLPGGRVHITLDISKRPNAFEGLYHTSASEVRDTLAMVLDQITQDGIGSPNSDSLPCSRNGIMAGWRLYLGHSEKWRRVLDSGADAPGNSRKVPGKVAGRGGDS